MTEQGHLGLGIPEPLWTACACGGYLIALDGDRARAVREHQGTDQHRLWRVTGRPAPRTEAETIPLWQVPVAPDVFARLDHVDWQWAVTLRWRLDWGRPITSFDGARFAMSRIIACPSKNETVVHRNDDLLDCRRTNLVVLPRGQSYSFRKVGRRGSVQGPRSSAYRGVSWSKGRWQARHGEVYLGRFDDEYDAAQAVERYLNHNLVSAEPRSVG